MEITQWNNVLAMSQHQRGTSSTQPHFSRGHRSLARLRGNLRTPNACTMTLLQQPALLKSPIILLLSVLRGGYHGAHSLPLRASKMGNTKLPNSCTSLFAVQERHRVLNAARCLGCERACIQTRRCQHYSILSCRSEPEKLGWSDWQVFLKAVSTRSITPSLPGKKIKNAPRQTPLMHTPA